MSQAKVDKYKKEKKNRAKEIKKKKFKKGAVIIILAGIVGAAIGFPLGKYIYKVDAEKRAANETITAGLFANWFDEYWTTNGYSERVGFTTSGDYDDLISSYTDAGYSVSTDTDAEATE